MTRIAPQLEVLDLRHFSAAQMAPLLREEARQWNARLQWNYDKAAELLLEYLDGRILPGFVALYQGRVVGYTFCVYEGAKAVIGDLFASGEGETAHNPVCETLLHHVIEMLQASPGVSRVEAQLLMFPADALKGPFLARGFRPSPRLFMLAELAGSPLLDVAPKLEGDLRFHAWRPEFYDPAAQLIHRAYTGHMDSNINDQYQTLAGAQRFLHNIIRFPGCGEFMADNSWVVRDQRSLLIEGAVLSSRVRSDTGHITQICVSPSLRHHGLGHALLTQCAREFYHRGLSSLSLTVTEANYPARELYDAMGFVTRHRFNAMVWDAEG